MTSYMVIDLTDPVGLDDRPFGKFGPFPTREAAQAFVDLSKNDPLRCNSYAVYPSEVCR